MNYELIVETKNCTSFSNHLHNRDGLMDCFNRIEMQKDKKDFVSAQIISERDGLIFELVN